MKKTVKFFRALQPSFHILSLSKLLKLFKNSLKLPSFVHEPRPHKILTATLFPNPQVNYLSTTNPISFVVGRSIFHKIVTTKRQQSTSTLTFNKLNFVGIVWNLRHVGAVTWTNLLEKKQNCYFYKTCMFFVFFIVVLGFGVVKGDESSSIIMWNSVGEKAKSQLNCSIQISSFII